MLAYLKLYLMMRMRMMNLKCESLRAFSNSLSDFLRARYTEEEIKTFEDIMKLERGFKNVVKACATDTDTFLLLIAQVSDYMRVISLPLTPFLKISNAAAHSRSDDTGRLKSDILEYIYEDPKKGSRFSLELQHTRPLASDPKALRGFLHIDLADLLCPLNLKAQFERDPVYAHFSLWFHANSPLLQEFYEPSQGRNHRNHSR